MSDDPALRRDHPTDRRERSIELSIASNVRADRTVMEVDGELDLYTAPALKEAVNSAADDGPRRVILDLTGVPFMDSSGLGVIVGCLKHLREMGGDLSLVTAPGSPPAKLLSLTGLDKAIPTFASVDEALG